MKTSRFFLVALVAAVSLVSIGAQAAGLDVQALLAPHADKLAALSMLCAGSIELLMKSMDAIEGKLKDMSTKADGEAATVGKISADTKTALDAIGIQTVVADKAGCCGALRTHLNDHTGGLDDMRRNIDAWWPLVSAGTVEAIVMNASGCGVQVKDYGHALAGDAAYAEKAARISSLTRDLSELLPEIVAVLKPRMADAQPGSLAFHPPCTLQHGQQLRGGVEQGLRALGFEVSVALNEPHLCCGSAGTYSVLQPELSHQLRDRKLGHLAELQPTAIVSANVGCIQHLQSGTATPVRHWVEVLDEHLRSDASITHVVLIHCETGAGVENPLADVAAVCERHGKGLIVDAMSSFAALPIDARTVRGSKISAAGLMSARS